MTPALMHLRAAENSRWERGRARPQRADRREVFVSSFKTICALSADGDVRAPSKMKFLILKLIISMTPLPIDKKAAVIGRLFSWRSPPPGLVTAKWRLLNSQGRLTKTPH